jgi:hypothetical protein
MVESEDSYQAKAWRIFAWQSIRPIYAPLYSKTVQFRHATVADTVDNSFQPRLLPQQTPSEHYASPIRRLPLTMQDQSYRTGLSPETKQKIDEFTRLMNKYSQFHTNPDGIIKLAIHNCINGDNTPLDLKLEQLRTIDALALAS